MRTLLHHLITETAKKHPDADALIFKDQVLSYRELNDSLISSSISFLSVMSCATNKKVLILPSASNSGIELN